MTKWLCSKRQFRETWISTLKSDTHLQISDGTVPGLYLRYSPGTNHIRFYLGCRIDFKHRNIFLGKYGELNVQKAKEQAEEIRVQMRKGLNPIYIREEERRKQELEHAKRIPFETLFNEYMEKYTKLYKKPSTYDSNVAQYRLYLKPHFGNKIIVDVMDKDVVSAYTDWANKTSFSTANKALYLLSSFWQWCQSCDYLPKGYNPCQYVKKGKNKKIEIKVLDKDTYKKFFDALERGPTDSPFHERFFHAIKVLALTGCRSSEIKNLTIREVDLEQKILHLKDSKTGARDVKLSDLAAYEIKKAINKARRLNSPYVFPGIRDPKKPMKDPRKAFMWILENAGLDHRRIHDLRHSFISMGVNMGENIMAIKDAAGHTRVTTTESYSHMADNTTFTTVNNIANAIIE